MGKFLRETRERNGLSQRRLAVRAGTSQDAISRIERGAEAPTLERLVQLMSAFGQRLVLDVEGMTSSTPLPEQMIAAKMSPAERLREASSWNRTASELAAAGERARAAGHPAARRDGNE